MVNESMSLLEALKVPNLGSFILFTIAFKCLPVTTRKMFESASTADYPSIIDLLKFVRSRVSILENDADVGKSGNVAAPVKVGKPPSTSRRMGITTGSQKGPVRCHL